MPDLAPGEDLHLFAGIIRLKKAGEASYQDVGEYAQFDITPNITTINYKSRKQGTRKLVREDVTEEEANFTLVVNSISARNLAMGMGGVVTNVAAGHDRVTLMETSSTTADLQFEGTNDVGQQIDFHGTVQFRPGETFSLAQDEYTAMSLSGQMVANIAGHFGTWDVRDDVVFAGEPPLETA